MRCNMCGKEKDVYVKVKYFIIDDNYKIENLCLKCFGGSITVNDDIQGLESSIMKIVLIRENKEITKWVKER
ncbi:MAG TPA: hypothetical protein ENI51_07905 [Candidatus Atribacteria bacterium]|nr:hypothetical protein [Candidatus Atribacteria bacterium]